MCIRRRSQDSRTKTRDSRTKRIQPTNQAPIVKNGRSSLISAFYFVIRPDCFLLKRLTCRFCQKPCRHVCLTEKWKYWVWKLLIPGNTLIWNWSSAFDFHLIISFWNVWNVWMNLERSTQFWVDLQKKHEKTQHVFSNINTSIQV